MADVLRLLTHPQWLICFDCLHICHDDLFCSLTSVNSTLFCWSYRTLNDFHFGFVQYIAIVLNGEFVFVLVIGLCLFLLHLRCILS